MSLELNTTQFLVEKFHVSISFGDLMSLERDDFNVGDRVVISFNLLWRSNVVGTCRLCRPSCA